MAKAKDGKASGAAGATGGGEGKNGEGGITDDPNQKYGVAGVLAVHFSSDDQLLFSGGDDGFLHCFLVDALLASQGSESIPSAPSGTTKGEPDKEGKPPADSAEPSADEDRKVQAKLQPAASGTTSNDRPNPVQWKVKAHRGAVTYITSSKVKAASGHLVFTSGKDGNVACWACADGNLMYKLSGHTLAVNCVAIRHCDQQLFSASADKVILAWDRGSKKEVGKYLGHTGPVWFIRLSNDEKSLYSASEDKTIRVWDIATVQCLQTLEGHRGPVYSVVESRCAKFLFSCSRDRTVAHWDLATGKRKAFLVSEYEAITGIDLSIDGRTLYVVGGSVSMWRWGESEAFEKSKYVPTVEDGLLTCVACSPDNLKLAVGKDVCGFRIFDTSDFSLPRTLNLHKGTVSSLTTYKQFMASASEDTRMSLWNLHSGNVLRKFEGHTSRVWSIAFSLDGTRLFTASEDSTVRVWLVESGRCLQVLRGHSACVWALACVPGMGKETIVSAGDDMSLVVWSKNADDKFERSQLLNGHKSPVVCLAAADGFNIEATGFKQCVASGSFDNTISLWLLSSGEREVLNGHGEVIWAIHFLVDHNKLVSGSEDKTVRIWDLETLSCERTIMVGAAVASMCRCLDPALPPTRPVMCVGLADGALKKLTPDDLSPNCVVGFDGGSGKLHTGSVCAVLSTPTATITGSVDMTIRYWSHKKEGVVMELRSITDVSTKDSAAVTVSNVRRKIGTGNASAASPASSPAASGANKKLIRKPSNVPGKAAPSASPTKAS